MLKPATNCPRLSVIIRWGCPKGTSKAAIERWMNVDAKRLARTRYMSFPIDRDVRVGHAGNRLSVEDRVICCYSEEVPLAKEVLGKYPELAAFRVLPRPRSNFGDEGQYMERNLIPNPGFLCICDAGLFQVLPQDRTPGQGAMKAEDFSAKVAFMLRIAKTLDVKIVSPRPQDNIGADVYGLPPQSFAAATGFVNINNPRLRFVQQLIFFAADARGMWPSWSQLEDRSRVENEQEISGTRSVAVYEGCTVRFTEKLRTEERHCGDPEWQRNYAKLKNKYGVILRKRHPRHLTPGRNKA